jgi:hypothetical protein
LFSDGAVVGDAHHHVATFVLTILLCNIVLLETLYVVWKFDEASFVKDGIAVDRANLFSTRLGDQLCPGIKKQLCLPGQH